MLSLPSKLHIFILSPQWGRTFWEAFTKSFLESEAFFSHSLFLQKFSPKGASIFFFFFLFPVARLGKYMPFIKKKKKSHPGKSRVGRLGVLTISPWSIFIVLSFFLFGFKVLWYYEKQQKSFYINHLSAKMTDARRRRESMVLALKLQQKEGFVNFQQGRILLQVLAPLLSILPQKKIN